MVCVRGTPWTFHLPLFWHVSKLDTTGSDPGLFNRRFNFSKKARFDCNIIFIHLSIRIDRPEETA